MTKRKIYVIIASIIVLVAIGIALWKFRATGTKRTKIDNYSVTSEFKGLTFSGFYGLETDLEKENKVSWRWTNGKGEFSVPDLYTKDGILKADLLCYVPEALPNDTPSVVLNNEIRPISVTRIDKGFQYKYQLTSSQIISKVAIINKSFIPFELDKNNLDKRDLGLIFTSISFHE